jgi:NAD(P)-dependent dehydrogenase (short-subunit alcohol dehydrogenase family)
VLLAGAPPPMDRMGSEVRAACTALKANVSSCQPQLAAEDVMDDAVKAAIADRGAIDLLVVDGDGLFMDCLSQGADAHAALRKCLDCAWEVTRAVTNHAFLLGQRGGQIIYVAPAPDAGQFAQAACAGLENLARTLSVEWARYEVSPVCIAPGMNTTAGEVAALCAYLASPAGAYFSGCLLDLRGP